MLHLRHKQKAVKQVQPAQQSLSLAELLQDEHETQSKGFEQSSILVCFLGKRLHFSAVNVVCVEMEEHFGESWILM